MSRHYNDKYFQWQQAIGELGGKVEKFKFQPFTKKSDKLLDFGCGGAYIMENLDVAEKMGIEINPHARSSASDRGLTTVENIADVEDSWADVIISNHALEHTHHPLTILQELRPKLKKGGKIVFVVPHEINNDFKEDDINQHLYTWSPQNLGNLFKLAGFNIVKVDTIKHRWPPKAHLLYKLLGAALFHLVCLLFSRLRRVAWQTRVVATV